MKLLRLLLAAMVAFVGGPAQGAPPSVTPSTATVTVSPTTLVVAYPAAFQLVQVFTSGTMSSAVPIATGQIGLATDTGQTFYATGTSAGNWASTETFLMANGSSSFQIISNGSGGYKLALWNGDQTKYQEIRLAGVSGSEHLIIGP